MKQLVIIAVILTALSISCYYDTEESLYPDLFGCETDTVKITYSSSISPMMENNCLMCHGSTVAQSWGGDINLDGYQNVVDNKDYILGSIRHDKNNKPMPKGSSKLETCYIQMFEIWMAVNCPK
jgi:hypothetical protein